MEENLIKRIEELEKFVSQIKNAKVVVIVDGKKEAEIKESCDCDKAAEKKVVACDCEKVAEKKTDPYVESLIKQKKAFKTDDGIYLPVDDDKIQKTYGKSEKVRKSFLGIRKYWYLLKA